MPNDLTPYLDTVRKRVQQHQRALAKGRKEYGEPDLRCACQLCIDTPRLLAIVEAGQKVVEAAECYRNSNETIGDNPAAMEFPETELDDALTHYQTAIQEAMKDA